MKSFLISVVFLLLAACTHLAQVTKSTLPTTPRERAEVQGELWRQVEVVRTGNGVPHIRAENLRAAGYALAWLQCEDYGTATPMEVLEASGRSATVLGYRGMESDMAVVRLRERSLKGYDQLSKDTRDVYEGFAAGVNRYVELHPEEFQKWMPSDFSGRDVAAMDIIPPSIRKIRIFGPDQSASARSGLADSSASDAAADAWCRGRNDAR